MPFKTPLAKFLLAGLLAFLILGQAGAASASATPAATDAYPPDDTFDGVVLDPYKWRIESFGAGTIAQNDRLIAQTSNASGYSSARVYSVWNFTGDFDAQVDFQAGPGWDVPLNDHLDGAVFGVVIAGQQYHISRLIRDDGGSIFLAWNSTGTLDVETPATALQGKLRLTRSGTTLTFWYDVGAGWQALAGTPAPASPASAYMGNASINANQAFTTWFDNFHINSGLTNYVFRPGPPVLLAPADKVHLLNNQPTFDWGETTGALSYTLQISKNSGFTALLGKYKVSLSSYTPKKDLPAHQTLYWRVQGKGVHGLSAWSAVRSLATAFPPSTPKLTAPGNNAILPTYTPKLDWSNSKLPAGAPAFDHYRVQVATDFAFSIPSLVVDQKVPGLANSVYTLVESLAIKTRYYWRVSAYNVSGEYSAWSKPRIFRTK